MKNKGLQLICFLFTMLLSNELAAQEKAVTIKWSVAAELPVAGDSTKNLGLAGVFSGVHQGVLLIAGGANFPNGMPWTGGKKELYKEIYILHLGKSTSWIKANDAVLDDKTAYGASVTTKEGVVCIGGETDKGFSRDVFLLQWDARKNLVVKKALPSLPFPLANAAVTAVGNVIYLMGGENSAKVSDALLILDLNAERPEWVQSGTIPMAMSHSVAVAQSGLIYLIGGRTRTDSGISNLHNTVFGYDPVRKVWKSLNPVHDAKSVTNLSAASGVPVGKHHVLIMGGDKGDLFNKIETFNANIAKATSEEEKQRLQQEKVALLTNHQGFSKDALLYDTRTDEWSVLAELPYSPVTTCAVKWNDQIFIPSGEIKPGRRTPEILKGVVKCK